MGHYIACRSSCKTTSSKMNAFVAVIASLVAASQASVAPLVGAPLAYAGAKTLVRAPAHDSASIANHRLGGNFAYAVQTAEAFAEVTPKIAHQTIPVAEHTHVHQPAAIRTIQPAPIITKTFSASPVLAEQPVFGQEAVIGPVATEVTYKQPIYKTRTYTQTHQVAHAIAQPAVAVGHATYAAAPALATGAIAAPALATGAIAAPALAHGAIAAPALAHGGLLAGGAYAHGLGLGGLVAGGAIAAPALGAVAAIH